MTDISWVVLENHPTSLGAEISRARLELAGIEAMVLDGETGNIGIYNNAIGGIRLMVHHDDFESAREILAADLSAEEITISGDEDITGTSVYCPNCHSRDLETTLIASPDRLSGLARWVRSRFLRKYLVRCRACGKTWRD